MEVGEGVVGRNDDGNKQNQQTEGRKLNQWEAESPRNCSFDAFDSGWKERGETKLMLIVRLWKEFVIDVFL